MLETEDGKKDAAEDHVGDYQYSKDGGNGGYPSGGDGGYPSGGDGGYPSGEDGGYPSGGDSGGYKTPGESGTTDACTCCTQEICKGQMAYNLGGWDRMEEQCDEDCPGFKGP